MAREWGCSCPSLPGATPDHRNCRRVFANGTTHYGQWCRTCGKWESMPRHTLPAGPMDDFARAAGEDFQRRLFDVHRAQWAARVDAWHEWYALYLTTPHWLAMRAAALARDAVCRGCGESGSEQVHHLTYARLGCELLTDVVGLCCRCHELVHSHNRALCPCSQCETERGTNLFPDPSEAVPVELVRR